MVGDRPASAGATSSERRADRRDVLLGAVPVFLVALGLYVATLLPDVGLWDTAEMQTVGPVLGVA
ncbi:MAG: hypothetical protein PVG27_11705, partial [Chloroflexota bacterium]